MDSLLDLWVPGLRLRLSGSVASAFTHQATSPLGISSFRLAGPGFRPSPLLGRFPLLGVDGHKSLIVKGRQVSLRYVFILAELPASVDFIANGDHKKGLLWGWRATQANEQVTGPVGTPIYYLSSEAWARTRTLGSDTATG